MEKKNRRFKRKFIIISVLLFLISIVSSYIYFYFDYQYQVLFNSYHELKKMFDDKQSELTNIEKDVDTYRDINEEISLAKKEYFSLLKQLEDSILSGQSDKKIAYLTFDDGPYYNTYQVFDILEQYHVGATFFTTDVNGDSCHDNKGYHCHTLYPEYLKRGHTIANHTYTHAIFNGLYNSVDSFMDAVSKQEDLIKEKTGGYITNIVRFPGGSDTASYFKLKDALSSELRKKGYGWVDWTALDGDGGYVPNREAAWNNLTNSINEDIEVILFHDYSSITTSILPDAISFLRNKGYVLAPLFYDSNMIQK